MKNITLVAKLQLGCDSDLQSPACRRAKMELACQCGMQLLVRNEINKIQNKAPRITVGPCYCFIRELPVYFFSQVSSKFRAASF
jgi:hypothetical protein